MVYGQGKIEKTSKAMKVGALSKLSGVSRDTVRLYEKLGLLKNISRPYEYNNYKEYGEENVKRIHLIKQMQTFGITLKESKEILVSIYFKQSNYHSSTEMIRSMQFFIDSVLITPREFLKL